MAIEYHLLLLLFDTLYFTFRFMFTWLGGLSWGVGYRMVEAGWLGIFGWCIALCVRGLAVGYGYCISKSDDEASRLPRYSSSIYCAVEPTVGM